MADPKISPFSLDTLASLSGNPEDIYPAISYYKTWRPFFSGSLSRLAGDLDANLAKAFIDNDAVLLQKLFASFLESARILPQRENMYTTERETPYPDTPVVENLEQTLRNSQMEITTARNKRTTDSQRVFIKKLVDNFSSVQPDTPEKILSEVEQKLKADPTRPETAVIRETISKSTALPAKAAREIETYIKKTRAENEIFSKEVGESLLSSPEPGKTASAIVDVLSSPSSADISISQIVNHANGVTAGIIALSRDTDTRGQIANKVKNEFFATISQTLTQKTVWAPLADIATTILGRDKVIEYLYEQTIKDLASRFGKSFASSETKVNSIAEAFFSSPAFRGVITDAQKHIADTPGGGASSLLSPARGFVDNVIRPIFRKPLEESVVAYMHAVVIEKIEIHVALRQFYLMMPVATPQPSGGGILSWIFHLGTEKGTEALADAGMKKAAGTTVSGAVKTGVTTAAMAIFGWTPPAWLAASIGWLGSKVIMPVGKFLLGGIGSLLSLGPIRLLMTGAQTAEEKMELMETIILAGIPLLIYIFIFLIPSPINFQYTNDLQKKLVFVNTGIEGLDESGQIGVSDDPTLKGPDACDPVNDPDCAVPRCDPNNSPRGNCAWATTCGIIVTGPGGGTHSMSNLNAVDIIPGGCGQQLPIHSVYNGTVVSVYEQFAYGQRSYDSSINHGYGNSITIRSTDPQGREFLITYGHLWYVAQYGTAERKIQPGDTISVGDPIGKMDDNGYSYGDHLHLEVRNGNGSIGGPSVNTILPVSVPTGCDSYASCGSINIQ